MIQRALQRQRSLTDPSPTEIRRLTAEIRRNWSVDESARRAGFKPAVWMPPLVEATLLGDVAAELDARALD
jgi:hypothetical protein